MYHHHRHHLCSIDGMCCKQQALGVLKHQMSKSDRRNKSNSAERNLYTSSAGALPPGGHA